MLKIGITCMQPKVSYNKNVFQNILIWYNSFFQTWLIFGPLDISLLWYWHMLDKFYLCGSCLTIPERIPDFSRNTWTRTNARLCDLFFFENVKRIKKSKTVKSCHMKWYCDSRKEYKSHHATYFCELARKKGKVSSNLLTPYANYDQLVTGLMG